MIKDVEPVSKSLACTRKNDEIIEFLQTTGVENLIIHDRSSNYISGLPFDNQEGCVEFKMQ